ncbi:MAG: DUF2786 domain-containing protein [Planctomycetes bacterium]|nr:DUF2786 domain-containing protein [Planctomycetota bacterium]
MECIHRFYWNDGGRSSCGFVGLAGDCVTRAISIATGLAYRDVYNELSMLSGKSPRAGMVDSITAQYLISRGWERQSTTGVLVEDFLVPVGTSIIECHKCRRGNGHVFAVIDGVLHDTWDPREELAYEVTAQWTPGPNGVVQRGNGTQARRHENDLTQAEFEKIIQRLRAIDNTARNHASTESERENALRMMQSLLMRHNLTRQDITGEEVDGTTQHTRLACAVNGSRALAWEKDLAFYVTDHIFPLTQWYYNRQGHRTVFFFYGPKFDVDNALQLFRELLLTIASAAKLLYGGYARGSGASYAEGYVASLPKSTLAEGVIRDLECATRSAYSLIQQRALSVQETAREWLDLECGIRLVKGYRRTRDFHDPAAEGLGRMHGAQHQVTVPDRKLRLGVNPPPK